MRSSIILSLLTTLITAVSATGIKDGNPTHHPTTSDVITAGVPFNITWTATSPGTITIALYHGPSAKLLQFPQTIVQGIKNTGVYTWTPEKSLDPNVVYGIQLVDDATTNYQWTDQFSILNPSFSSSSSSPSSSSSSPSSSPASSSSASSSSSVVATTSTMIATTTAKVTSTGIKTSNSILSTATAIATIISIPAVESSTSTSTTVAPQVTQSTSLDTSANPTSTASSSSTSSSAPPVASNVAAANVAKTGLGLTVGVLGIFVAAF